MKELMSKTAEINYELQKFDRTLADSMKPLTEIENRLIYHQVLDKFALGQHQTADS